MPERIEVEIKLRVASRTEALNKLKKVRAKVQEKRHFEENTLYDDGARSLQRRGDLLRLRVRQGMEGGFLTYKGPPPKLMPGAKVRTEIEVHLDDPRGLDRIFRRLNFNPTYRYQKFRTVYRAGGLDVMLDELPFGCFLELEGSKRSIDALARRLGYKPNEHILLNYRSLHIQHLRERGLPDQDMVFPDSVRKAGSPRS
ncbi:MAG: class IV adenylate cyclase [Acidobacteriota bacterium]